MEPAPARKHPKVLTFSARQIRAFVTLACVFAGLANAQRNRILRPVDNQERATLTGHMHPRATAANDQGRAAPTLHLDYVTLGFNQTASQKADLARLLADQQNPNSPGYHQWLTPEQYAERFGISQDDLNTITAWLRSQGLTVVNTARGRDWIAVSGTAAQVESAFQTEIHEYQVNGETHFANAMEPSVPAALGPVIMNVRGLNNFRMKPLKVKPRFTQSDGSTNLAPDDLATIYDLTPLYNQGINGSGQKIAVAGQTDLEANLAEIQKFRNTFGLPANLPQPMLIPGSSDPGLQQASGDLAEADIDVEWSGAVARNATILYVYAYDVMNAVQYAIDQNLAPVVSTSYGTCEAESLPSDFTSFQQWAQKGSLQGITWFNASGDAGAADCDDKRNPGKSVDLPASVPEVTGVGGTELAENGGHYWNATNTANGGSALSYIPETSWNDSAIDGSPSASGGGASTYFPKPSWQSGPGVPADNVRDVPDVSLSASADHDGYIVYTPGCSQPCIYGGTSVSAQLFAGIGALMNQYLAQNGKTAGLGNLNARLYALAQSIPAVFHDITTGNNTVTVTGCAGRVQPCSAVGYNAGAGYDQVTGLGSVDVCYLTTGNSCGAVAPPPPSTVSLTLLSNVNSLSTSDTAFLIATATSTTGVTPVGTVVFTAGTTAIGSATLVGSNGVATASLAATGAQIGLGSTGSQTVTATYNGSSAVTASVTLSARATSASGTPKISGITNAGSFKQVYAPGEIVAVFGSALAPATSSTSGVPFPLTMAGVSATINGQAAPLWYVSSGQFNLQIPYETTVGNAATLEINNNGAVTSQSFMVAAAAPGIFTDVNGNIANGLPVVKPGTETTLYITGMGAVTPAIATGAAPPAATAITSLPAPTQNVTVAVNGVRTQIEFDGIIWGLVGVAQINFTVPPGTPVGAIPVTVTVGSASATANLLVSR